MKKSLAMAAAAVAVSLGGFAQAADLARPMMKAPPPLPPISSWTGCYVGAGYGYGMYNQQVHEIGPGGVVNSIGQTNGGRGWIGTAQIGCDWQITSNIVIGAFADYDWSGISGDAADGLIRGNEKLSSAWAAGGRVGWVVVPQLLAYVSFGGTQARFDRIDFVPLGIAVPVPLQFVDRHTYNGWFIGTGYEYALGFFPGLYWKTEYRFSEFQTDRLPFVTTATGVANGFSLDSHKYVQTIRSELVWRFNWGKAPVVANY